MDSLLQHRIAFLQCRFGGAKTEVDDLTAIGNGLINGRKNGRQFSIIASVNIEFHIGRNAYDAFSIVGLCRNHTCHEGAVTDLVVGERFTLRANEIAALQRCSLQILMQAVRAGVNNPDLHAFSRQPLLPDGQPVDGFQRPLLAVVGVIEGADRLCCKNGQHQKQAYKQARDDSQNRFHPNASTSPVY